MKKKGGLGKIEIILIVSIILLLGIIAYIQFVYVEKCESFECFRDSMEKCKKAEYRNEQSEAVWGYEIKGEEDNLCKVGVAMLLAKEGDLGLDNLIGYEMDCYYPIGVAVYPEKDLESCHGRLKEELQKIIIDKLHSYIIENLGKVEEALNESV